MTTAAEFQAKVDKSVTNMDRLDAIVNGGVDDVVETDNGDVPSLAKVAHDTGYTAESAATAAAAAVAAGEAAEAASDVVAKPIWAGKVNGWPDTFFRRFDLTEQTLAGRDRWYGNGAAGEAFGGWSRVANGEFKGGFALQRAGGYNNTSFSGPMLYLDEIDAAAGDTITAYVLVIGSGGTIYGSHRWLNAAGAEIANGLMSNAAGSTGGLVSSSTPQWLRVTATAPTNAARIALWVYSLTGSESFDVLAVWAFKGGTDDGPDWPSLDDNYFSARDEEIEDRLSAVEVDVAPYLAWQHSRGDTEMIGNASYPQKLLGEYEQVATRTVFNTIQAPAWASNDDTDIEWKVFIRDSASSFNPSLVTPDASGTIDAGDFPTSDQLYTLTLPDTLIAEAGKYVFRFWRAADDSNVNIKRWLYDAGVSPARHGFALATGDGWNQSWALSGQSTGYGQVALKLLNVTDRDARVDELAEAIATFATVVPPYFTIPSVIYAIVGGELNLYHDAIFSAHSDGLNGIKDYSIAVIGAKGKNKRRCFRFTPVSGDIGTHSFTATARDAAGNIVATRSFSITVVAATPKASAKNVLLLGDSLIGGGVIPTAVQTNLAALGGTVPTLVGSQGSAPAKHEGRGGKTFGYWATAGGTAYRFTVSGVTAVGISATYTTGGFTYTVTEVNVSSGSGSILATGASAPAASGTLTKATGTGDATITFSASATEPGNPLWNSGALNVTTYRSNQSISAVIDFVAIQLGINDVFGEALKSESQLDAIIEYAKDIADAFLADNASCEVVIELPTICGNTNDGFAANYGSSQSREIFETNIFALRAAIINAFDSGAHHANVKTGSAGLQVDRWYGYATSSVAAAARISTMVDEHINGVHPGTDGYEQNGDAITAEAMALL